MLVLLRLLVVLNVHDTVSVIFRSKMLQFAIYTVFGKTFHFVVDYNSCIYCLIFVNFVI